MGSNKLFLPLLLFIFIMVFMGYAQDPIAWILSSLSNVASGSDVTGLGVAGLPLGNTASSMVCAQKILQCKYFLKPPSSPSDACCVPLKQMIHGGPKCLCNIFNNDELLKTFGVTHHEALKLLIECVTKANIRQCNNTAPAGSADPTTPPKTSTTTPTGAANESLNGTLNIANDTTDPAPASKNSTYNKKISLFGGFGSIALFTSLFLSA